MLHNKTRSFNYIAFMKYFSPLKFFSRPDTMRCFTIVMLLLMWAQAPAQKNGLVFSKKNLVAWCIVPFDSKKRGPEERAIMLNGLGITKFAYDWRREHIPSFDAEMEALKKHNITLQSFWYSGGLSPEKDENLRIILELLKRHNLKTQLWCFFKPDSSFHTLSQEEKVRLISRPIAYVAGELGKIGCSLGLYNHGGWYGEPENQLAIIQHLNKPNIGIVYNFSHAENEIRRFPEFFPKILPHLYTLNITGMQGGHPAVVVPVGRGNIEKGMIDIVRKSSYRGPIGIINEDFAPDAEDGLKMNMEGLKNILKELGETKALQSYQQGR